MIARYVSYAMIVALIDLNITPRAGKRKILNKTIAFLPFKNDSPDKVFFTLDVLN